MINTNSLINEAPDNFVIQDALLKCVEIIDTHDKQELNRYAGVLKRALEKGAMFDARAFSVPKDEVCNCLIWRQQDATRNSIEAVGQAYFSANQLHKKTCNMIQEMLWSEKGINWNDFSTECKRGSCCYRVEEMMSIQNPVNEGETVEVKRRRWTIDREIPIFTQDRDFVNRWL